MVTWNTPDKLFGW